MGAKPRGVYPPQYILWKWKIPHAMYRSILNCQFTSPPMLGIDLQFCTSMEEVKPSVRHTIFYNHLTMFVDKFVNQFAN